MIARKANNIHVIKEMNFSKSSSNIDMVFVVLDLSICTAIMHTRPPQSIMLD